MCYIFFVSVDYFIQIIKTGKKEDVTYYEVILLKNVFLEIVK